MHKSSGAQTINYDLPRPQARACLQIETLEPRNLLSGTPPTVTDVYLSGTEWTSGFQEAVSPVGEPNLGFRVPLGDSPQSLPWFNINKIAIRFSEDVLVNAGDLSLTGINAPSLPFDHFFYSAMERVATWTLANPLSKNTYHVDLDGNGLNPVRDLAGNPLIGGDFECLFKVMPGDVNQDSLVTTADYDAALAQLGAYASSPNYDPLLDVDGSGAIGSDDLQDIQSKLGSTYQFGTPIGVLNDAPSALDPSSLVADIVVLTDSPP